jgi:aldose 1-epimerase
MEVITLGVGDSGLWLAPAAGGAVTRYWRERGATTREWLRPATDDWLRRRDPYETSAFPLVPFSNRIREGRFRFQGREVVLPRNRPPERHSIHGHGWQAEWEVLEATTSSALLQYRHDAGAWPWAYRARQRFTLTSARLTVELMLRNESDAPMPAGLGWHPYFPRTPRTTLTAEAEAMWLTDDEMLPTTLVEPPAADLARGVGVEAVSLDNCFVGWRGHAVIDWPELDARVVMRAETPLDFLTVFTPPGRPFLCAEPVSHATDAVNLVGAGRTDTGLRVLPPGEMLRAVVIITPEGGDA